MSPFIFVEKIEKLKYVSFIAIFAIFSFSIMTIYNFFVQVADKGVAPGFEFFASDFRPLDFFGSFPTLLLAFAFQFNVFPIYKSLADPGDK